MGTARYLECPLTKHSDLTKIVFESSSLASQLVAYILAHDSLFCDKLFILSQLFCGEPQIICVSEKLFVVIFESRQ